MPRGRPGNPSHCRFGRPLEIKRPRGSSMDGLDFISSLPNEILQHIFSFLPTNLSIRTSVLSKRWRHVWSGTPCLFFDRVNACYASCESINETLGRYSATKIMSFHLQISIWEWNTDHVNSMIEFAMTHNVEKLTLTLNLNTYTDYYSFPDCFFINSSLKQLTITTWVSYMILKCTTVSWTSLKSLSMQNIRLSDESFLKIISGCPVLESLTLEYCVYSFRYLDLSKSLRLTRLDIACPVWEPMQIMAPHIRYLRLRNSEALCTLVDVSSVIEADLDTCHFLNPKKWSRAHFSEADSLQAMVQKMLEKLQNVEKLTVGMEFLHILSLSELSGVPLPILKVKTLILETKLSRYVVPGIVRLVQSSPGLKKITVYTITCSTVLDKCVNRYMKWQELDLDQCWRSEIMAFPTRPCDYEVVEPKLVGSLMELLRGKSRTLETLVVYKSGFSGKRFLIGRNKDKVLVALK